MNETVQFSQHLGNEIVTLIRTNKQRKKGGHFELIKIKSNMNYGQVRKKIKKMNSIEK